MFAGCSNLTLVFELTNANITTYDGMFTGAATGEATITINYTAEVETLLDSIIAASTGSNITKGTLITE